MKTEISAFRQYIGQKVTGGNGFDYILRDVMGRFALIQIMAKDGTSRGFEAWKLRISCKNRFSNKYGLRFPSNEDFGTYGWSYSKKENAMKKIAELMRDSDGL